MVENVCLCVRLSLHVRVCMLNMYVKIFTSQCVYISVRMLNEDKKHVYMRKYILKEMKLTYTTIMSCVP